MASVNNRLNLSLTMDTHLSDHQGGHENQRNNNDGLPPEFQSHQPDEAQGFYSLELLLNTTNSFPSSAITTATATVATTTTTVPAHIGAASTTSTATEKNGRGDSPSSRKTDHSPGHSASVYRGVTSHRWTGRSRAKICHGVYDEEEKAARTYDMAALKFWGPNATTNFPTNQYKDALEQMQHMTRQEYVASLQRKSNGFSWGASQYRGVTRVHDQDGRWEARIGRVADKKQLYLGRFSSEKEVAEAYDVATIKFRGRNAVTNFDMSKHDLKTIAGSIFPLSARKRVKIESQSAVDGPANNGCSTDEECTMSSQTNATSYISNAATAEWLHIRALQQQSRPLQPAYELQKVPLYNQDLHRQVHSGNQQKYYTTIFNNGLAINGLRFAHYLPQQQQSGLAKATSEAAANLTIGNAPSFSVWRDPHS